VVKITALDWSTKLKGIGLIMAGVGVLGYVIYMASNHKYWYILNATDLFLILVSIPLFLIGMGLIFDFKKPKINRK
jgi:ABC-type dipeptide/oligopeptide/nickel transport system permease component